MGKNGFTVLSPEKLTLEEQVYYFQTAEIIAAMSGTITHNIVFAHDELKVFIFNRTCVPNNPQLTLNRLLDCYTCYVDTYAEETQKHPRDYGSGPFWIEPNENFRRFCMENGLSVSNHLDESVRKNNRKNYRIGLLYFGLKYNRLTKAVYYQLMKLKRG